jgi:hypothetical protein
MLYNAPVTKDQESPFHFAASLSHIPDFNELNTEAVCGRLSLEFRSFSNPVDWDERKER